jgi:orotate phosphoribosyltransferase
MTYKNELLAGLSCAYEYREKPFQLSSGIESHEYLDCRQALSDPRVLKLAALSILEAIDDTDVIEAVGGLTMGADPLSIASSFLSLFSFPVGWFSVRKEPKQHGTGRLIEGFCKSGSEIAILEDVSTTGSSAIQAAMACRNAGMRVNRVIPLVDRGGIAKIRGILELSQSDAYGVLNFSDISLVGRSRLLAIKAHGSQIYGDNASLTPYSTHLSVTVDILAEMLPYNPFLLAAGWLHDCLEDTEETAETLSSKGIPGVVVSLVDACTDGEGKNRRERKERPFRMIPSVTNAILIKLADRIANTENAQKLGKDDLLNMYRKENPDFHERLKNSAVSPSYNAQPFWDRLAEALS